MPEKNQPARSWHVVEFKVERRHEEMAGWLMMQLGANGCEVETDNADRIRVRATFERAVAIAEDAMKLAAVLDEYGLAESIASLRFSDLQEEDWLAKWKEGFEPFEIGDRLIICPPWRLDSVSASRRAGKQLVVIEPGLAFGTGFHETTRFCLEALQQYIDAAHNIADIGAGSAILSIACALLNERGKITALETDEVACANAGQNLALNGVSERITLVAKSTEALRESDHAFDLILANLTYEDHVALIGEYKRLGKTGGHILFAGILREKAELMESLLLSAGVAIITRRDENKWTGFVAQFG